MIAANPKKFYGLALSFFPKHGLNVCAMVDQGDRNIIKDNKRSFRVEPKDINKESFEKVKQTVKDLVRDQKKENKKDGLHYSVPITIGWPGEQRVPKLAYLKTDKPAIMWGEPQVGDDLSEQIRLRLLKEISKIDPNYEIEANKVGSFRDPPDEGFPTEIRDAEADQTLSRLHQDAVTEKKVSALNELIKKATMWASYMADEMIERNGPHQARTNKFFLFADPEVRWFNIPEVVTAMKATLRDLLGIPRQEEIDIKFTNSPESDPFFNVTRPEMATQIRKALKQKFYGVALSFYDKKLKVTAMVDEGDRKIKVDEKNTWEIDEESEVKDGMTKLLKTVVDVAKLQEAENKRCGNHKYIFPVTIGWPGDNAVAKGLEELQATNSISHGDNKDIYRAVKEQIDTSIKEATGNDFQFNSDIGTFSKHVIDDSETPEDLAQAKNLLHMSAKRGDPSALREIKRLAVECAHSIADRLLKDWDQKEDRTPAFIKIPHPDDQYMNVPEAVAIMKQVLQARFNSPIPIDIKFAEDESSPQFYNVNRPNMEALIDQALAFD